MNTDKKDKKHSTVLTNNLTTKTTSMSACVCNELYVVEFPGIELTDTNVNISGGQYPSANTVQDLITNNPQFWVEPGISGINTLKSIVVSPTVDIVISVTKGGNTYTTPNYFVGGRPIRPIAK